jgi:Leucine-rich repeat (LRR) protein
LGFLNELQILDLEQNRIVEVHSDISKLEKLQILGLGHNELT